LNATWPYGILGSNATTKQDSVQVGAGIILIGNLIENFYHSLYCVEEKKIYNSITHTEIKMFSPEFFIDSIQAAKRSVFNRIIQDKDLQQVANRYLDAQTDFAKMMVRNAIDLAKYSVDKCFSSQKEQASQAPYKVEKEAN